MVTGIADLTRIAGAVEAGAVGYVLKSVPFDRLLAVVWDALAGRRYWRRPSVSSCSHSYGGTVRSTGRGARRSAG